MKEIPLWKPDIIRQCFFFPQPVSFFPNSEYDKGRKGSSYATMDGNRKDRCSNAV